MRTALKQPATSTMSAHGGRKDREIYHTPLLFPAATAKSDRDTGIQLLLLPTSPYRELERIHSLNSSPPSAQGQECDMLFKQSALMR